MIVIHKPQLIEEKDYARLESVIEINGVQKTMYFQVERKYASYLCWERGDAFVVGLLSYAMRKNEDISCEAPLGEDLYYQLTTYLIDALCKGNRIFHRIRIIAEIDSSDMGNAGGVGTGISCGVDSLHVLAEYTDSRFKRHNLTHLLFNNVGSHKEANKGSELYEIRKRLAEDFCRENQFDLVEVKANITDVILLDLYWKDHAYFDGAVILALQKLFSIYYYASSRTLFEFTLSGKDGGCAEYYESLLMESLSISSLKIYFEGSTLTRLEKTARIVDYTPSYKYLNVCREEAYNCSRCEKCIRTMLGLDALGKLDLYRNVFDLTYYREHFRENMVILYKEKLLNHSYHIELYPYYKDKITLSIRLVGFCKAVIPYLTEYILDHIVEGKTRNCLKSFYHFCKRFSR